MKNRTLQHAFPIVAAAIGNRFGIKVSVGGDQAYTTGTAIQLPAYDGDDPDYQEVAWGLLAHEAAHIRYSDFTLKVGGSALRRRLCGAIEDVRIEHELAKDFPGTRLTLRTVIEKMIAKGSFAASNIDDHPANILYGYVLKSLRSRVLGQSALQPLVDLTEAALNRCFPKGAVIRLKGLLSEVPEGLMSESDALNLADRILTMIQQECEQPSPSNQSDSSSGLDNSTNDDESGHADQDNDVTQTTPVQTTQADDDPNHLAEDASSKTVNHESRETTDYNSVSAALLTAKEDDFEQDVFEAIKSSLALEPDSVSEYVMPIGNEPPMNDRVGLQLFQKVQGESGKIRAALQGLVQSHSLSRSQPSGRGRLNGKCLHRLRLCDTNVFQRSSVKPSPNTAIHVLLDKSESMGYPVSDKQGQPLGNRMPIALEATLALALAFEGIAGVNPGITAFPGHQTEGSVYRLLDHGQRIRQRTGAFSLVASGTTPMTEAIWFGAAALLHCREPRKVLMVMTDGQPDDKVSTLDILQRCRDSGIETVGIGLGVDVSHLFPVALAINDLQELRTQLFELSKSLLLVA